MKSAFPLLFEKDRPGRKGFSLPPSDLPQRPLEELLPRELSRKSRLDLPRLSEVDVVRHYTGLSRRNYGVDSGFYPLGSCTMKYNPKVNEDVAALAGFSSIHPLQGDPTFQGALELLYHLEQCLNEITGMERYSFQTVAGAHGELTGLLMILAYHRSRGEMRNRVLIPDSAHGTNPATVNMTGCEAIQLPSDERGLVDTETLKAHLDENTAALMLTNPNTLGLFEKDILEISRLVHEAGGLLYYDGANLNAIMGHCRPGDMGFDVVHLNLHKTFSTPHGSGGPGSGPLGVTAQLEPFLPYPIVSKDGDRFFLDDQRPLSIGKVHSFFGNFGVVVKAYTYIRMMGAGGLKQASNDAVLNANYLLNRLQGLFQVPYKGPCKHEFVLSARLQKKQGAGAGDIAKALLDYGLHPPTVYFPLIVEEALMIEPTETESKETLDHFIEALQDIVAKINIDPGEVKGAPYTTPVRRLDEVLDARKPVVRWKKEP